MERAPVSSSNVASVGYEEFTQTLEVEFHDGSVYQYFDVPRSTYEGLINASSVGSYLHHNIKGKYRYVRL